MIGVIAGRRAIAILFGLILPFVVSAQISTTHWKGTTSSWSDSRNWDHGIPGSSKKTILSVGSPSKSDPIVPSPEADDTAMTGDFTILNGGHLQFDPNGMLLVRGTAKLLGKGSINLESGTLIFSKGVQIRSGGVFKAGAGTIELKGEYFKCSSGAVFSPGSSTVILDGSSSFQWVGAYSHRWTREEEEDDDDEEPSAGPKSPFKFFDLRALTQGTIYLSGNFTVLHDCYIAPGCTVYVTMGSSLKVNGTLSGGGIIFSNGAGTSLPVQLTSFDVTTRGTAAYLRWTTATEVDNFGFDVERRIMDGTSDWTTVAFVPGYGTSTSTREYSFTDRLAQPGRFAYRLKQTDKNGATAYFSAAEVAVGSAPAEFTLGANYPNPFNPSTTIEFTVPDEGRATLKVFNLVGQEVASLYDNYADVGRIYQVQFSAVGLPSGLYFYQLRHGNQSVVRRMSLVK